MKLPQTGKKSRVYYVGFGLIILWILLPVFAKSLLYRGMNIFHAPVETLATKAGQVQDYWALRLRSKNRLIEDYRELSRQHAHDRMQVNRLQSGQAYVDRLERLLSMSPVKDYRSEYARVIRRDVSAWFESIRIDKGSEDGVAPEQAVVFGGGLVGRVTEVQAGYATVRMLSSPLFRTTVNVPNDDRPIAYSGLGQLAWSLLEGAAEHIPQDVTADINEPLPLYTSGLGEGLPSGILVGELISVEPELEGLFQKGRVRLNDELRSLREVVVLIPLKTGN